MSSLSLHITHECDPSRLLTRGEFEELETRIQTGCVRLNIGECAVESTGHPRTADAKDLALAIGAVCTVLMGGALLFPSRVTKILTLISSEYKSLSPQDSSLRLTLKKGDQVIDVYASGPDAAETKELFSFATNVVRAIEASEPTEPPVTVQITDEH